MGYPFAHLIDLLTEEQGEGFSRLELTLTTVHLNLHHGVHGELEAVG